MTDQFHTTKEAARILKISPNTMNNWRIQGRGPAFRKFGSRVVYAASDLAAWAQENKNQNTQEAAR